MIIARETTDTFKDDAQSLFEADWKETNPHADKVPLAIDVNWYQAIEKQGNLFIFTARLDGVLCGYLGLVRSQSKHHGLPVFVSSGLYIAKPYRGKRLAIDLLKKSIDEIQNQGACLFKISSGAENDIGMLLKAVDARFKKEEIVYSILLG